MPKSQKAKESSIPNTISIRLLNFIQRACVNTFNFTPPGNSAGRDRLTILRNVRAGSSSHKRIIPQANANQSGIVVLVPKTNSHP